MSPRHILAIDQGTTNTKVLLIDESGRAVAAASAPLSQSYPRPGWVEQDPAEIWSSVLQAIDACLGKVRQPDLAAVAVSNQRESAVAWERTSGRPLGPLIGWQCRRTAPLCDSLRDRGLSRLLMERTGLTIDPLFSGTKMQWHLEAIEDGAARARRGDICLGTVDGWVLFNLTGGAVHACDTTNASRTQLFDTSRLKWDDELLEVFGIPRAALPEVRPSSSIFGKTVALGRLPAGLPVAGMIGDSHGALFGQAGFRPGAIKATYGTGSSLMTPTNGFVLSGRGLSSTVAWAREGHPAVFALEGNISMSGAAVQWLGEFLRLDDPARGVAEMAAGVASAEGVYLVPAFVGLGAPHWCDSARGTITGLTRGSTAAHLARATLDAVGYQIRDVFEAMQADAGTPLKVLLADGGASRNDRLMQFQADILGCPVLRSSSADLSALGAAYLAGLAVGVWGSEEEIEGLPRAYDRFEPKMDGAQRDALCGGWRAAVAEVIDAAHNAAPRAQG